MSPAPGAEIATIEWRNATIAGKKAMIVGFDATSEANPRKAFCDRIVARYPVPF
jgi:hypothetical protein